MNCLGLFVAALYLVASVVAGPAANDDVESEKRLFEFLMRKYNRDIRPASVNKPVDVKLGLSITRLHSLNFDTETIELHGWLTMSWNDPSLIWNTREYGNVSSLPISVDRLWTPDIKLYNSVDHTDNHDPRVLAAVDSEGGVFYVPRVTLRAHCTMNVSTDNIPWNTQYCVLTFGSWSYSGLKVNITVQDSHSPDVAHYTPKSKYEWFVQNATSARHVQYYQCCTEPYIEVDFSLIISRQAFNPFEDMTNEQIIGVKLLDSEVHVLSTGAAMILPLVFLLPFESHSKITLGSAGLICLTLVIMRAPDAQTAAACQVNIVLVCVALVLMTILLAMWHSDSAKRPLPRCMNKVVDILARFLCVRGCVKLKPGDAAQLQEVTDETSPHEVIAEQCSLPTLRTLVLVIDRILFVVFLIVGLLCNFAVNYN